MYDGILITENIIKQWDYLDHDKEIRRSWQKKESFKLNRKKINIKKPNKMIPFLMKKVFYISPANFILGNNEAVDNTVLMLILSKVISKVTKVINKIKHYTGCRGNVKLCS